MFIKDESKVASRVSGVKCGVVYLVKLLFKSNVRAWLISTSGLKSDGISKSTLTLENCERHSVV